VAGLEHDADLGRIGFQRGDVGQQPGDRGWGVLTRRIWITPSPGRPRAMRWNASAQSIPTPSTMPPWLDHDPKEGKAISGLDLQRGDRSKEECHDPC
jgi:hypothetical protein